MTTRKYKCFIEWDTDYNGDISELPTTLYVHLYFDEDASDKEIGDALVEIITDEIGYCINSLEFEEIPQRQQN